MGELHDAEALHSRLVAEGERYAEFLHRPAMSAGVYRLTAGESDRQSPHAEDEVYVVLSGRAMLRSGDADFPVAEGSVAFVPGREEHGFHDVIDDLLVVAIFAPAEGRGAR